MHKPITKPALTFTHLQTGKRKGEVVTHQEVALQACKLAAERGVGGAAAALAHAYATCMVSGSCSSPISTDTAFCSLPDSLPILRTH